MKTKSNIGYIKNITSIDQLAVYDEALRKHVRCFVRCNETADDIVNDAYLYLHKILVNGKVIDGGYVHMTLSNLNKNHLKYDVNRYDRGNTMRGAYIPEDNDDVNNTIEDKMDDEIKYDLIEDMIAGLSWYEQKILEFEKIMSLYELSKRSGITYRSLCYTRQKIRVKMGIPKKHHADSKSHPDNLK